MSETEVREDQKSSDTRIYQMARDRIADAEQAIEDRQWNKALSAIEKAKSAILVLRNSEDAEGTL